MRAPRLLLPLLLALALLAGGAECFHAPFLATKVVVLEAGPDLEFRLRAAVFEAQPGTLIELPAGTFAFRGSITVETPHVQIRGQGMDQTILDYAGQVSGSQGILSRGDGFVVRDLTILDPAGDGVKTEFVDGATFRNVKVEWTRGAHPDNGDYGLYPAQNKNVLVEGCQVIGARDAGIYVGQSENVIVRNSYAAHNVLGIEIENSIRADVYGNLAEENTGGIAVFNLPDLQVDGHTTRVFENVIRNNNTPNFAAGGILRSVPGGTGLIVIGQKILEVFDNEISGNDTVNLFVASFQVSQETITDADYDPYVETVHIHDNVISNGGQNPQGSVSDGGELGFLLGVVFGSAGLDVPDLLVGGYVDPAKVPGGLDPNVLPYTLQVADERKVCIHDNSTTSNPPFANLNGLRPPLYLDLAPHDCTHPPLPRVVLPVDYTVPRVPRRPTPEEVAALCDAPGAGVNWDAYPVDCPELSSWRLFPNGPLGEPEAGGVPYDLTTPLFSDHAHKARVVFLPPGGAATYHPSRPFDMPVGTIIAKTFWFELAAGGQRTVETRLLIHREDGWHGLPYIWNADESEAFLSTGGGFETVTLLDPDGGAHTTDYEIPSAADCGSCHFGSEGDEPIGPKARLLNRDYDYAGGTENQLDHWTALGVLAGSPGSAAAPVLATWDDPATGSQQERARAYLESNCAHCHNPIGRAGFTGLWLSHDTPIDDPVADAENRTHYGFCKRPVAAGSGALGLTFDVVPGSAAESILVGRMDSAEPAIKMPELAKSLVHDAGVALVADWIDSLAGGCPAP